jgi:hypothetical protein
MNINSIQTNEVVPTILRSPERNDSRVDAGKGLFPDSSVPVPSSSSASNHGTQSPAIEAQTLITRTNYTKEQLEKILVNFPPFFPAGSYQRVDLIKAVRGIQDQVEKSSIQSDLKQQITAGKLSENATDSEISAALDQLFSLRDELSKSFPMANENLQPGALVSIRV